MICSLDEECPFCTGEACMRCGAGIWSDRRDCEHDVLDRHEGPEHASIERRYGAGLPARQPG